MGKLTKRTVDSMAIPARGNHSCGMTSFVVSGSVPSHLA